MRRAGLRFRIWFCRRFLGRTPKHWVAFGYGLKRYGYYKLDSNGHKGVFIDNNDQVYI